MNRGGTAGSEDDYYRMNPWRAPGFAPTVDACGVAGGAAHKGGGAAVFAANQFAKQGDAGSQVLQPSSPPAAVWRAGETVEVSWGLRYNHGGGYTYRLAKAEEPLTEANFDKTPLAFDGMPSLRWADGKARTPPRAHQHASPPAHRRPARRRCGTRARTSPMACTRRGPRAHVESNPLPRLAAHPRRR
jgi:hypothetical protein